MWWKRKGDGAGAEVATNHTLTCKIEACNTGWNFHQFWQIYETTVVYTHRTPLVYIILIQSARFITQDFQIKHLTYSSYQSRNFGSKEWISPYLPIGKIILAFLIKWYLSGLGAWTVAQRDWRWDHLSLRSH